jgi:hypothetical protein
MRDKKLISKIMKRENPKIIMFEFYAKYFICSAQFTAFQ